MTRHRHTSQVLHGFKGRVIAGIAGAAGVLSALAIAIDEAHLLSIVPEAYKKYLIPVPIIALFVTGFSERLQGGASNPEVRDAAAKSDAKKDLERLNQ